MSSRNNALRYYCLRYSMVFLGLLIISVAGCRSITGMIAEKVYPDLVQPAEIEAPSTFTTYLSSANTEAILGGMGAGLNCSIPELVKKAVFKREKNGSDISLRFRQACVMHDFCYRHGYATYRYSQADCDTQLQQSAYRLCRQIHNQNDTTQAEINTPLLMYTACEKEAKEILLGVTLGGAGSFHDKDSSTYFEYDPMPAKADDYVVGRAVPLGVVNVADTDFGIRTFYYKRNTVKMRVLAVPSENNNVTPIPFPEVRIATPPVLTGISETNVDIKIPSLVSLARNSFSDTSIHLIRFDMLPNPIHSKNEASYLLALAPCLDNDVKREGCNSEVDASVRKFAVVDNSPVMVSLTHRGNIKVKKSTETTVKIVQQQLLKTKENKLSGMTDYMLNGSKIQVHNQYRFLAHDMLLERGSTGEATHAWVFARGVQVDKKGAAFITDDKGDDYSSRVAVARQRLGNNHEGDIERFSLNVKETDEPLSLVRLGGTDGSALVSLAWSEDDLKRIEDNHAATNPPRLKIWRFPQYGGMPDPKPFPLVLPALAKDGYVAIPPVIARLSNQKPPLIVMTHVGKNRWVNDTEKGNLYILDVYFYIVRLVSSSGGKFIFDNDFKLHCQIDLNKQLQSEQAEVIRKMAHLTIYGEDDDWMDKNPEVINYIKSDLAQRWNMSQVVVSEKRFNEGSVALALSMIFNGFPSMSFQILLDSKDEQLHYFKSNNEPVFLTSCFEEKTA
ncbi:hypothetical protein [Serratia sp. NPDC087055]|uniref:hypothetical protein n=1 Tax=Serratia sp. NPDC087055 TaxID=3364516 RepID=UPI0038509F15